MSHRVRAKPVFDLDRGGRPSLGRFSGGRTGVPAASAPREEANASPPLHRVTVDGKRPAPVKPEAVTSAIQLADFLVVLATGLATFAAQSVFAWSFSPLPCLTAVLVLVSMMRAIRPGGELYGDMTRQRFGRLFADGAAHALTAFGFAVLVALALLAPGAAQRAALVIWLLAWTAAALAGIAATRLVLGSLNARWRAAGRLKHLVAIYGTGELAERLVQRLRLCTDTVEIVGVFDDRSGRGVAGEALRELPHGTTDELVELSHHCEIDRIIVALPHAAEKRLLEILRKLHKMPVEISLAPDMVGFNLPAKDHAAFGGLPLLDVYSRPLSFGQNLVKGAFDRLAAAAAIVVLSPVLLAVALAIRLDSKGPALFRQNRYGFGDRIIQVFKFRTMKIEASDANGEKQTEANDPRLTRIGGFLRKWSIDELPQLFNVLRGELSLVGPRPHAISMRVRQRRNEDIVPDYALRHHVKPGITGWAQVNGYHGPVATETALRERVAYDLDYINHWSLWFDVRIIVKTLFIAFGHRHAY